MMHEFDIAATKTIVNLEREFGVTALPFQDLLSPVSIGIELEIKFKYLFPDLHKKYFENMLYNKLPEPEQRKISEEISIVEAEILAKFRKTKECGIPQGADHYWEFAFTPVYNLSLLLKQINILEQIGLIPNGQHSLQINIGNVKVNKKAYIITSAIELLFVSKERIASGFVDGVPKTWTRKGRAGIREKLSIHLQNAPYGYEIRTTEYTQLDKLERMFMFLVYFLDDTHYQYLDTYMSGLFKKYNLPNTNWGNPNENINVWKAYIENYNEMSTFIKNERLLDIIK